MQRIVVVVEFFEHCGWGRKVVPKRRQVICAHFVPVFECVCACAWDYVTTRLFFFLWFYKLHLRLDEARFSVWKSGRKRQFRKP